MNGAALAWFEKISTEPDPGGKLELFAAWSRALFTGSHDLVTAVHRRRAIDDLIAALHAARTLRDDLTAAQAADRAWILTGPELYLLATTCG